MASMTELSQDLVEEILCRVPITSLRGVRSTCALSQNRILCKTEARHDQFLGFTLRDSRVSSVRFNLHGILNEGGEEFVKPSIKEIGNSSLDQVEVSNVFHCDGLLLCVTRNNTGLAVWNPYLGQTRWIPLRKANNLLESYAIGYDKSSKRNHKILRILGGFPEDVNQTTVEYEIYDLSSDSWKVLDITLDRDIDYLRGGVLLKGDAYFLSKDKNLPERGVWFDEEQNYDSLVCFDFTAESFGKLIPLPFERRNGHIGSLSCFRDEKLATLYFNVVTFEFVIWVTTKVQPDAASWVNFLKLETRGAMKIDCGFLDSSFFIDEEKKVAVVFYLNRKKTTLTTISCNTSAYVIEENGYLKEMKLGKSCLPRACSSCYLPSLVQINQTARGKRKREEGDDEEQEYAKDK